MWKYPYKTKPYEHQRNALNQSAIKNQWAYFMEMGTGKTKVTIDNMAYLYLKKEIDSALVIACLLYTSPSPRDKRQSRMPSSA